MTERLHFHFLLSWLEKEMATHSSVLAWRIPGTGEPGGLPFMGSHRVRHDWSDLAAAAWWSQSMWYQGTPNKCGFFFIVSIESFSFRNRQRRMPCKYSSSATVPNRLLEVLLGSRLSSTIAQHLNNVDDCKSFLFLLKVGMNLILITEKKGTDYKSDK